MKDAFVSTCEKKFLLQAVTENQRLDGRKFNEYRNETIHFGADWGSCLVTLGETRVFAQVSCDIQPPKASKPNEGLLFVHVEVSPMAALHFESNRQSDISVQVNRLLDKCLKESKCVDLEALCIVADEKVWNIRIDLNVMNYEGNLAGCCSIAALAALAHFKHPDVTSTGEKIIIHSYSEKDPIPINLHHYPVIISYALFNNGQQIVNDPTALEEKVADSLLLLSVNSYREICGMHFEGIPLPSTDVVVKCSRNAVIVASHLVKQIKKELANDLDKRGSNIPFGGLTNSLNLNHILSKIQEAYQIKFKRENTWSDDREDVANNIIKINESDHENDTDNESIVESSEEEKFKKESRLDDEEKCSKYSIKSFAVKTAELTMTDTDLSMNLKECVYTSSDESDEIQFIKECKTIKVEEIQLSGDSEEEEIVILHSTYKQ